MGAMLAWALGVLITVLIIAVALVAAAWSVSNGLKSD